MRGWTAHLLTWSSLALAGALGLSSCGKTKGDSKDRRSTIDPELAKVEVDAAVVSDDEGAVEVLIAAGNPNTQVVKASAGSRIAGSTLAFPPGAFDIDFQRSEEHTS